MKFERYCIECGERFEAGHRKAEFCCSGHRYEFSNRRRQRGMAIYDVFMAMRYERGLQKLFGLWTLMCRMAEAWRDEDKAQRAGRKSWQDVKELYERGEFTRYNYTHKGRV